MHRPQWGGEGPGQGSPLRGPHPHLDPQVWGIKELDTKRSPLAQKEWCLREPWVPASHRRGATFRESWGSLSLRTCERQDLLEYCAGSWAARGVHRVQGWQVPCLPVVLHPLPLPTPLWGLSLRRSIPFHIQLSRDRAVSCQAASLTELPREAGLGGCCSFLTAGKLRLGALSNLPRPYLLRSGRAVTGSWGCGLLSPVLSGSTRTPPSHCCLGPSQSPLLSLSPRLFSCFLSFGAEVPRAC